MQSNPRQPSPCCLLRPGLMLGLWRRDGVKPPASQGAGGEIAFTVKDEAEVDAFCADWRARH